MKPAAPVTRIGSLAATRFSCLIHDAPYIATFAEQHDAGGSRRSRPVCAILGPVGAKENAGRCARHRPASAYTISSERQQRVVVEVYLEQNIAYLIGLADLAFINARSPLDQMGAGDRGVDKACPQRCHRNTGIRDQPILTDDRDV